MADIACLIGTGSVLVVAPAIMIQVVVAQGFPVGQGKLVVPLGRLGLVDFLLLLLKETSRSIVAGMFSRKERMVVTLAGQAIAAEQGQVVVE